MPSGDITGQRWSNANTRRTTAYAARTVAPTAAAVRGALTRRAPSRGARIAYAANAPGSTACHTNHRYADVCGSERNRYGIPAPGKASVYGTNTSALNIEPHASASSDGRRDSANCPNKIVVVMASPMRTAPP